MADLCTERMRVMGTRVLILYHYEFLSSRGCRADEWRRNEDADETRGEERRGRG
jgi:hypothetical protein